MQAVECRYRGTVIGWLESGPDGFLKYVRRRMIRVPRMTDAQVKAFREEWDRATNGFGNWEVLRHD